MYDSIIALLGKAVSSHLNDLNLLRNRSLFISGGGGGGGGGGGEFSAKDNKI